jgi:phage tail-like protein
MPFERFQPNGVRIDPFNSYNFLIRLVDSSSELAFNLSEIRNGASAGFSECSGLESTLEIEPLQEGGNNGGELQFPTRIKWSTLKLKRGMALTDDLWLWHYGFVEGRGRRKDGIIVLQNDLHLPVKAWKFVNGLPARWSGPALNAAQNGVAVEELEIAHEGLEMLAVDVSV